MMMSPDSSDTIDWNFADLTEPVCLLAAQLQIAHTGQMALDRN